MEPNNVGGEVVLNEEGEEVRRDNLFDLNVELKVELPPCSSTLDIGNATFLDFLSVYAFLRSFSTLLFLSPFEMNEFAASVVVNDSTPLFDAVHLSLMRAIQRCFGSACLSRRPLNWDLLDSITWPVFLVEYLSLHAPEVIPGLDLSEVNAVDLDNYSLAASAKVAILQQLCDDLVETEVYRSELERRAEMAEKKNLRMKYFSAEGQKKAVEKAADSSVEDSSAEDSSAEKGIKEENGDECYLCKMDGEMLCCDSCPAALHARCVGVVSNLLPEGDKWHCPECRFDQTGNLADSIRGAQLLGVDPHGRLYYEIYHCLLVWDELSLVVYKSDDLAAVVAALDQSPSVLCEGLTSAISEHWNLPHGVSCRASSSSATEARYINLYEFAGMASSISEEMSSANSARRTSEQIIARQLRIIRGKHVLFSWSNTHSLNVYLNSKKERCGWCFTCKNPEGGRECLFVTSDNVRASDVVGIQPRNGRRRHAVDVMPNILSIERCLQDILQHPPYSDQQVASLKKILLQVLQTVEVNLQQLHDDDLVN